MPLQLFTSLVNSSTTGDMVGGGFFRWESLNFVLSAADKALRSGSSSPAPRTQDSNSMVSSRPSSGAAISGGQPRSTLVGSGATALGLGPGFQHSCSFGFSGGVGSLDTQSASHSDDWAHKGQSISPRAISNVSSPHVAPNIVPKGASFPFAFVAALLRALTLAFATSIPRVGEVSDGGIEDTTEGKAAAIGSLPSRRLRSARVMPGASALALGRAPSPYLFLISSAPLVTASSPRGPVSTGTLPVDEGRTLTTSLLDLVLVIGTVLALRVTDIFTVQDTSFYWCSSCSALVF